MYSYESERNCRTETRNRLLYCHIPSHSPSWTPIILFILLQIYSPEGMNTYHFELQCFKPKTPRFSYFYWNLFHQNWYRFNNLFPNSIILKLCNPNKNTITKMALWILLSTVPININEYARFLINKLDTIVRWMNMMTK